jgi:PmbA protein
MMKRQIMKNAMDSLLERGAQKVSLRLNTSMIEEFNIVFKELNLLRTVESHSFSIAVIKDQKQASTTLNQFDDASLTAAIEEVMSAVEHSNPDPAFDISPTQAPGVFHCGEKEMDPLLIVSRMNELIETMRRDFPCVHYDATLSFEGTQSLYLNSNGVDFEQNHGLYSFMIMFTAKIGNKMSSFNYTGFELAKLDKPLIECNFTRDLISQIVEQTECRPIPANFKGEVILFPFVVGSLMYYLLSQQLGDSGFLTKSSRFQDHLGQKILDEKLSIYNKPLEESLANKGFVSSDGFLAVNAPIIEAGILKNYPISLYTANKVDKARTMGPVSNLVISSGNSSIADMIGSVKEGVLCMRASFGSPNANGDLSAVLKNSYYIKDGKLQYPISESMMSINLIDVFSEIIAISAESINTGDSILPYMQFGGAAISRK